MNYLFDPQIHHLDPIHIACRSEVLYMICIAHIQPRKHVLSIDHADYFALTWQRGLDDDTDRGSKYILRTRIFISRNVYVFKRESMIFPGRGKLIV